MQPTETASATQDQARDATLENSFPASDPSPNAAVQGSRAVDPAELASRDIAPPADPEVLSRRFPDAEAAKLALEHLVHHGPFERSHAGLAEDGSATVLTLWAPSADADRLRALLDR